VDDTIKELHISFYIKLSILFFISGIFISIIDLYPKSFDNVMLIKSIGVWMIAFSLSYVPLVGFLLYMQFYQFLTSHVYVFAITKSFMVTLLIGGFITLITTIILILYLLQKKEREIMYD